MILRVALLASSCVFTCQAQSMGVTLLDAYPTKARFAPSEPIGIVVESKGVAQPGLRIRGQLLQLGELRGTCAETLLQAKRTDLRCTAPASDFQGYRVEVDLLAADGHVLDHRATAVDVSSSWKRFPRYGYLAHYSAVEGTEPSAWIDELNKFHINGLEFYDFQYRHDQPLAGTVEHPAQHWKDIAGRPIDGAMVRDLIADAHAHNMMAMAYNASYSAFDDVFSRKVNPLPLAWATWSTADGPRTAATAKKFELHADHWSTDSLFYMNQNSLEWQNFLAGQMAKLFKVYAFDGWHVDTFGEKGGYAFDRSAIDYPAGFPAFIEHAHDSLHRPIVFNAVNTDGQVGIAHSSAEFVYSELWEGHETYASLLATADEVHLANPRVGVVFAAYVHRLDTKEREARPPATFNPAAVLLTDAVLFAAGASHIELGDGDRMLSSEYFPADTHLTVGKDLRHSLRDYYDFLTAYENPLRDDAMPVELNVQVQGLKTSSDGSPNTVWAFARKTRDITTVHLINLLGSDDPNWRDKSIVRPAAPVQHDLRVRIADASCTKAGWATPDVDGGRYHPLTLSHEGDAVIVTLPTLQYWDAIFLAR